MNFDKEFNQLLHKKEREKELPPPPKPPLIRMIYEGDCREKCKCGSSQKWEGFLWWAKSIGCINKNCEYYWDKKILWGKPIIGRLMV